MKKVCVNCSQGKNCQDSLVSWVFFTVGLIGTVAVRLVALLLHVGIFYAKLAWYVGVVGIVVFFVYRFRISQQRAKDIDDKDLLSKVESSQALTLSDRESIAKILCSLRSKKERINYFFIFALSVVALLAAIYLDIVKH